MIRQSRSRLNFQFAALPYEILERHDSGSLRDIDLVIVSKIIGHFPGWLIHETDKALAELCGVAESSLKACLKRLRALGLVKSLKPQIAYARRALGLMWFKPAEEELQPLLKDIPEAAPAAPEGPSLWPLAPAPLEPPNRSEEEKEDNHNGITCSEEAAGSQPSLSSSLEDEGSRKARREEVAAVVAEAARFFPSAKDAEAAVIDEAKKCRAAVESGGLRWVAAAVRGAVADRARSWRHVAQTLENWRNQGYATPSIAEALPKPLGTPSKASPSVDRPDYAPSPQGPPTPEEVALAAEWARGQDPSLVRLGRRILSAIGGLVL